MATKFMSTAKGRLLVCVAFFGFCAIAGGVMGALRTSAIVDMTQDRSLLGPGLFIGALLAAFAMWFGAAWMKSIDEAAQEAHKWSWYWGGTSGMAVAMIFYMLHYLPESVNWHVPTLMGRNDPVAYAVSGGAFVVILMLVGYTIAWALWWLTRR